MGNFIILENLEYETNLLKFCKIIANNNKDKIMKSQILNWLL